MAGDLDDIDRAILDALRTRTSGWHLLAAEHGISETRWAQRAVRLLQSEEAERIDPVTIHRWRRIMERRRQLRSRRNLEG